MTKFAITAQQLGVIGMRSLPGDESCWIVVWTLVDSRAQSLHAWAYVDGRCHKSQSSRIAAPGFPDHSVIGPVKSGIGATFNAAVLRKLRNDSTFSLKHSGKSWRQKLKLNATEI